MDMPPAYDPEIRRYARIAPRHVLWQPVPLAARAPLCPRHAAMPGVAIPLKLAGYARAVRARRAARARREDGR
jgi:hypothetical protein